MTEVRSIETRPDWSLEPFNEAEQGFIEAASDYVADSRKIIEHLKQPLSKRVQLLKQDETGKYAEYLVDSAIRVKDFSESYRKFQIDSWKSKFEFHAEAFLGGSFTTCAFLIVGFCANSVALIIASIAAGIFALAQRELASYAFDEMLAWGHVYSQHVVDERNEFFLGNLLVKKYYSLPLNQRQNFLEELPSFAIEMITRKPITFQENLIHPSELVHKSFFCDRFIKFYQYCLNKDVDLSSREGVRNFMDHNPLKNKEIPPSLKFAAQDFMIWKTTYLCTRVTEHFDGDIRQYQLFIKNWIAVAKEIMDRAKKALEGEPYRPLLAHLALSQ